MSERTTVRELRPVLREAEIAVARIRRGSSSKEILSLYGFLDQIATDLPQLRQAGARLEPEVARFETICAILRDKAHWIVRGLAPVGGLAAYRGQSPPPKDWWWWYLDQQIAQQRREKRSRLVRNTLFGTILVVVLAASYVLFLRPDKATRMRYDHQFRAEAETQKGNYRQALELYEQALELAPKDAELVLAIGVLYEVLQQPERAALHYAEAEKRYESPAAFRTARAQHFMQIGWYEQAKEETQAAIELDDRYALAHCALGSAYQGLGANNEAIAALWRCADLASEQGQDELYVHAKTLLAVLMQQPS